MVEYSQVTTSLLSLQNSIIGLFNSNEKLWYVNSDSDSILHHLQRLPLRILTSMREKSEYIFLSEKNMEYTEKNSLKPIFRDFILMYL